MNSLPKTTFKAKIDGGLSSESVQKIWDALFISETIEDSNFKFGVQASKQASKHLYLPDQ